MKIQAKVIKNSHPDGIYPVFYNGEQVGNVTVSGDVIEMVLDAVHSQPEKQADRDVLIDKMRRKAANVSSVGKIDFIVVNDLNVLSPTEIGFVINDLPEYIPPAAPSTEEKVV